MITFLPPVVIALPALYPIAVFFEPVVALYNDCDPTLTLYDPEDKPYCELYPKATFSLPVLFAGVAEPYKEFAPKAVFLSPSER